MNELAARRYRVERIESDTLSMLRGAAWQMATPIRGMPLIRPPLPDPNRPLVMQEADEHDVRRNARGDLVRILDVEGNVVWWREFRLRESGVRKHTEIMDDLMKLDAAAFRSKYGIIPERPIGVEPPRPADDVVTATAPGSASDPWGPWADRVKTSEGGEAWVPEPQEAPGGARPDDVGWGDWGQR